MMVLSKLWEAICAAVESFVETLFAPYPNVRPTPQETLPDQPEEGLWEPDVKGLPNLDVVRDLIRQKRFQNALSLLERASADETESGEVQYLMAECLRGVGRFKDAIQAAAEALRLGVDESRCCRELLADCYYQLGWLDLAIVQLREVVEQDPQDVTARLWLARVLSRRKGLTDQAIEELNRVLEFQPDSPEVHAFLGVLFTSKGELENARAEFLEARQLASANKELALKTMLGLAQVYCGFGEFRKARAEAEAALSVDPGSAEAHVWLAYVMLAEGRYSEAAKVLEGIEPDESNRALYLSCLGYALFGLNRPEEAREKFDEAARLSPELVEPHHGLSLVYSVLGKPGLADNEAMKALKLKPKGKTLLTFNFEFAPRPATYGDYEVIQADYAGGDMTRVHLARHIKTGELAAVKELAAAWSTSEEGVKRFQKEIEIASMLDHPGIAKIYADGKDELNQRYYYVMEFAERSLADVIAQEAPLAVDRIISIGIQLGEALGYCHRFRVPGNPRLHVVHRNLKPSNILVTGDGMVKICDFGKARLSETIVAKGFTATPCTDVRYASPEWARGFMVDGRTDIYSLGAVLYELATGKVAHLPSEPADFNSWIKAKDELPVAPSQLNPSIPPKLDAIILKAMEPDRNNRYQTVQELVDALKRLVGSESEQESVITVPVYGEEPAALESMSCVETNADQEKSQEGIA